MQADSRAAEAFVSGEEVQSALAVARSEARTAADTLSALQKANDASATDLSNANTALQESKAQSKELRDSLDKIREELTAVYARAHSAEVC